ncbi:MAG: pstS [Solirubrobacterales bacterium]|nr:pstS [Solirubrobacterales bacterium]
MKSNTLIAVLGSGALAFGAAACGSSTDSSSTSTAAGASTGAAAAKVNATLNGAGSTFAAPIYQQVASKLKADGLTVNYQGVGSGDGVAQLQAGTADFAGSDPALAPEDTAKMKGPVTQVPIALGAITMSYNLSGQKSGIKLDGRTIGDIYLGKVKKWNDPEIVKLNSGLSLPGTDITVVHRSDSSGTTKGFTQFVANYSPEWKSGPGVDKDIKWPTGTGAKGNDGVAASVKQTDGAIGYVEQAYALQNAFTFADVQNKGGAFVAPTLESTSAAAEGLKVPADLGISTIDSANAKAYPIVSQTFLDFPTDPCKSAGASKDVAAGLSAFATYLLGSEGQDTIKQLSYAPLPAALVSKGTAALAKVSCNGAPVGGA